MSKETPSLNSARARKPGIFYGYWILAVAFFCLFVSLGLGGNTFSLFIKPIEGELGWNRGVVMSGYTILLLAIAVSSLFVGRLVNSKGVRGIVAVGAGLMGAGFLLLSSMQSLYAYYLGQGLIGAGIAAAGQIPATTAVANWFHKRRGLAMGIMFTGTGIGSFVLIALIGGLLIPNLGWRMSYLAVVSLPCLILIPLALSVLRTKPSDMGLFPDGTASREPLVIRKQAGPVLNLTTRQALSTGIFWIVAVVYFCMAFTQSGFSSNLVPYIQETGLSATSAALAFSFFGAGLALGQFSFSWISDYLHPKYVLSFSLVVQITLLLVLSFTINENTPVPLLGLYVALFGFGMGCPLPTLPIIVDRYFGIRSYGTLFGILSLFFWVGAALGPMIAGFAHDANGNYFLPFMAFIGLHVIILTMTLTMRRE